MATITFTNGWKPFEIPDEDLRRLLQIGINSLERCKSAEGTMFPKSEKNTLAMAHHIIYNLMNNPRK